MVFVLPLIHRMDQTFVCEYCGTTNDVFIDPSGEADQEFVQDCRLCCRPKVIRVRFNEYSRKYDVTVYLESRG